MSLRTKAMIANDRTLKNRVEELKEEIYMSQEQTPLLAYAAIHKEFGS